VRRWRDARLTAEQAKFDALAGQLAEVERQIALLAQEFERHGREVRMMQVLSGSQVLSLHEFSQFTVAEKRRLAARREAVLKELEAQRARLRVARQDLKLLEKLEARQLASWRVLNERELQAAAEEAHLARIVREGDQ